jgi:hypothetical protein
MAVQTSYSIDHGAAYAGMLADQQVLNTVSKLNASGSTIEYGKAVATDTTAGNARLVSTGDTVLDFNGVVMRELNRAYATGDTFGVPDNRDMTVITEGVVWVKAAATVAVDEQVYFRVGATNQGDFSNAAGTGVTESILLTGAKFLTAGDTGDLVKISVGLGG